MTATGSSRPYRSAARDARAQETRRRVLATATELFTVSGYHATSMRAIAEHAGVSVPTIELLFGRKWRVLAAAIDVAIAGDDEPVPMLDRDGLLVSGEPDPVSTAHRVAAMLGAAQERSAGLMTALFAGADTDDELATLAADKAEQRAAIAARIVELVTTRASPRAGLVGPDATDVVWLLMEPSIYTQMTRRRSWSTGRYEQWFADALIRLLIDDAPRPPTRHRRQGP